MWREGRERERERERERIEKRKYNTHTRELCYLNY